MALLTDDRRRGWWWAENALVDDGWIPKMGPHTFAIYCVLVRCSDSRGGAFPSYDYLSEKSGVSIRHIPRCIERLTRLGLVEKAKQGGGMRGSNIYKLKSLAVVEAEKTPEGAPEKEKPIQPKGLVPMQPFVFQRAWEAYPRKAGTSKSSAIRAWNSRIKNDGFSGEQMAQGVERYAHYCHVLKTEQQYIKQPATFFGPDHHFLNDWTPPEQTEKKQWDDGKPKAEDLLDFYDREQVV